MQGINFQSGMKILRDVLTWFGTSKDDAITQRVINNFSIGVLKNSNLTLGSSIQNREFRVVDGTNYVGAVYKIRIAEGVAFDKNGERICISLNDAITYNASNPSTTTDRGDGILISTAISTGNDDIPVLVGHYYCIWIKYLQTCDPNTYSIHKGTKTKIFYKLSDGYVITPVQDSTTAPDSDSILLCKVDLTYITQPNPVTWDSITSYVDRQYSALLPNRVKVELPLSDFSDATTVYSASATPTVNTEIFIDDHIKSVGGGTMTPQNPHATS